MSILDREAKIFRFLFESAVFEREFAAEAQSATVNFQRFKMTPFNGEGPVRGHRTSRRAVLRLGAVNYEQSGSRLG